MLDIRVLNAEYIVADLRAKEAQKAYYADDPRPYPSPLWTAYMDACDELMYASSALFDAKADDYEQDVQSADTFYAHNDYNVDGDL